MITSINAVYTTEFDVIGGDIYPSSPIDPVFVYEGWKTSDVIHMLSGNTEVEYARANQIDFMEPYNSHVMSDRSVFDIDSFILSEATVPAHSKELDYKKHLIQSRNIVNVDGLYNDPSSVTEYHNLANRTEYNVWDLMAGLVPSDSGYLDEDYKRLTLIHRTQFDHRQLKAYKGLSVINGPYAIEEPAPIEGDIYKVFGTVQQKGTVPSYPTNVMIVNRSAGSLSTIAVTPDPQGRFVKYYKDLPAGTTFMVIGLWDPTQEPYFEPVIVDRIVATKL